MPSTKRQPAPIRIFEDNPTTDNHHFGFDGYADTLVGVIANKENTTPLIIGLYGAWGSGRTTMMKAVRSRLDRHILKEAEGYRLCKTVWFNAWKHDGKEALLAALTESVLKAMDSDGFFSLAKAKIDAVTKRIDKSKIFASVSKLAAGMHISFFFSEMTYKEWLVFYSTFQKFFNDLVWTFLNWRFKLTQDEKPDDKKAALVVFIDDLDRCTGPQILKMLETIKLFMESSGCVFVLGASEEALEMALVGKHGRSAARHLLDKVISVHFTMPSICAEAFDRLIDIAGDDFKLLKNYLPLLMVALNHNPRQLKRFINTLNLQNGMLRNTHPTISFDKVLFWALVCLIYPALSQQIKDHPQNLSVLQKQIKRLNLKYGDRPLWQLTDEQLEQERVPHALRDHIQIPYLVDVVKGFGVTQEVYAVLRLLNRAVRFDARTPVAGSTSMSISLLDTPMVDIAAGPFLFGDDNCAATVGTPFGIDIYPVTYHQYCLFIDGGGYSDPTWWSQQGWCWRKETAINLPAYWEHPKWHRDDHPVVGVSLYEADAYAQWAGKTLPTEQQWERSARGVDGWKYPWGNAFDRGRCNTAVQGAGTTAPVNRYSNGISPEGCYDMAGNVWEWTSNPGDNGKKTHIIKGGSWSDAADFARSSMRSYLRAEHRHPTVGFRCVRMQS